MPAFRPVTGGQAGPDAVGILVPPGRRTVVVIRPRALDIDLVVIQPGSGFEELDRAEAVVLAQELGRALVDWSEGGAGSVEAKADPERAGFWVLAQVGRLPLVVCQRAPGQAYRPKVFATLAEAQQAAAELNHILCPGPDAGQELYTNVQSFAR